MRSSMKTVRSHDGTVRRRRVSPERTVISTHGRKCRSSAVIMCTEVSQTEYGAIKGLVGANAVAVGWLRRGAVIVKRRLIEVKIEYFLISLVNLVLRCGDWSC